MHVHASVAFVIDAFPLAYEQYLGGFVNYLESICNFIGDRAVTYQVEIIKQDVLRRRFSFQPAPGHSADGAPGAVLEDNDRLYMALVDNSLDLRFFCQEFPIHESNL